MTDAIAYSEGAAAATAYPFLTTMHVGDAVMAYGNVQKKCAHCSTVFWVPSNKRQLRHCSFECRFQEKVERRGPTECWPWRGPMLPAGYGKFTDDRTTLLAHRVAFQMENGEIPSDRRLVVDHICNNRACVNPAHLQLITQRQNVMRGGGVAAQNARKTHCKKGHELKGDNLVEILQKNGRKERRCRTCERVRTSKWDANHREQRRQAYHDRKKRLA